MLLLKLLSTLTVSVMGLILEGPHGIRQCQERAQQLRGCTSMEFNPNLLQCKLNMNSSVWISKPEPSVHWNFEGAGTHNRTCKRSVTCIGKLKKSCVPVGKRPSSLQKGMYAKQSNKGQKKKTCIGKDCKASDTPISKDKDCILLQRENFTIDSQKQLIALPLVVKPGMKISVYGGYVTGTSYCQLSFSKDPKHMTNILKWVHVLTAWYRNYIIIADGFSRTNCNGSFPISDPTHFNLTVKLSSSSTKIYADQDLVWTMKGIPFIKELCLRRYDKVYRMVVQKTEDGCDEVDNGIP